MNVTGLGSGLTVDASGTVYVSVNAFSLARVASTGAGLGLLTFGPSDCSSAPISLAAGPTSLWILCGDGSDTPQSVVQVGYSGGSPLSVIESSTLVSSFGYQYDVSAAMGLATDLTGHLYVSGLSGAYSGDILVFNITGQSQPQYQSMSSYTSPLCLTPFGGVAVDGSGHVYAVCPYTDTVFVWGTNHSSAISIGLPYISLPYNIDSVLTAAMDDQGNVYVLEWDDNLVLGDRLFIQSATGAPVVTVPARTLAPNRGLVACRPSSASALVYSALPPLYLSVVTPNGTLVQGAYPNASHALASPYIVAMAWAPSGTVYLLTQTGPILVLDLNGNLVQTLTPPGAGVAGALQLDSAGRLYIIEQSTNQILRSSVTGSVWSVYTTAGSNGVLRGLSIDDQDNLYVFTYVSYYYPAAQIPGILLFNPSGSLVANISSLPSQLLPFTAVNQFGTFYALAYRSLVQVTLSGSTSGGTPAVTANPQSGSLCALFYSLPGDLDYPWSVATSISFMYNPSAITTTSGSSAVQLLSGTGQRTYTNRFGNSFSTPLTLATAGTMSSSNLLYLNGLPLDVNGLTLNLSSPVQLPGVGPLSLFSTVRLFNASGAVVEGGSNLIDVAGSAFLSNVAGFTNLTIGASNRNSLAVSYSTCQAPLTFTNGLTVVIQPGASSSSAGFSYSYTVSDGLTYSVQANLTLSSVSVFATVRDQLGNPYQPIFNITGTRTYTYLPTMATVTSVVSAVSNATAISGSQRWYPYSFLAAAPGIYSFNTVPFLDADGLTYSVSPSTPSNGAAPGAGTQLSQVTVAVKAVQTGALLFESASLSPPVEALQRQQYILFTLA